ncbi:MAG: hypothetical protein V2A56_08820 [bacterium]
MKRDSETNTRTRQRSAAFTAAAIALLLLSATGQAQTPIGQKTKPGARTIVKFAADSTKQQGPAKRPIILESPAVDSLALDSLTVDSLALDSLGLVRDTVKVVTIAALDTAALDPPAPSSLEWGRKSMDPHVPSSLGEALTMAPGLYPRSRSLYGQPFYALPPGGTGRDVLVLFHGRPFNDPLTDAANMTAFAEGELETAWISPSFSGAGPAWSGMEIRIDPWHTYPTVPRTRITYRQGLYGLGTVDWRITQGIGPTFSYHIGLNVSEYRGRYTNTAAKTTILRSGFNTLLENVGLLNIHWMESDLNWREPFERGSSSDRRDDVDIALAGGRRHLGNFREMAAWYVRSRSGYPGGNEDGYRMGVRLQWEPRPVETHQFLLRGDLEQTAARYEVTSGGATPGGNRLVAGATLGDEIRLGYLDLKAVLRSEAEQHISRNETIPKQSHGRIGGAFNGAFGDSTGPALMGSISSSWRWPALDETFGYWSLNSPGRFMDLITIPEGVSKVYGNPSLGPVETTWMGGGIRWRLPRGLGAQVQVGRRTWSGLTTLQEHLYSIYLRTVQPDRSGMEVTGSAELPLPGPFTVNGAWTWTDTWKEGDPAPQTWGWSALRYDNTFYHEQLRVRGSITARHYGEYRAADHLENASTQLDLLLSIQIFNFEVYYGSRNAGNDIYNFAVGYPGMHRGEVWGVRWILLN